MFPQTAWCISLSQSRLFTFTLQPVFLQWVLLRLLTPWKTLSNVFDSMRSRPKGTRRFKVEVKITAMSWAVYSSQDHGKFMLEGTKGALYPVLLLTSRLNFSFFFFHFVVIISHPPTRHPAVQSFISLMNLRASGATFRYVPSCLFPRMSQCCSFSLSSHPQRVSALTLSILVALSWTPSVHWCLPLDAFQRWLVFDFDTAALHVLSHYMLFADQEQPKSSQGFQRQITWLRIEPLELFSETLFLSKAKRPFHSNS